MPTSIAENLARIRESVNAAALQAGRNPESVTIVAVSKSQPAEAIKEAFDLGQRVFGENYVKEAIEKIEQLERVGCELANLQFEFIGHLQRNKVREVVGRFSRIQSVDSERLAEAIHIEATRRRLAQRILMQVNISGEATKSGVMPERAPELAAKLSTLTSLRFEGLMCIGSMAPEGISAEQRRSEFSALRHLRDLLEQQLGRVLPELSMGMSDDYPLAIAEGATIVRIGTVIFGTRPQRV